jgi:hypothetical protein
MERAALSVPHDRRSQSFWIVAGRKEELRGSDVADRIAGDEVRRQFVDDGGDHAEDRLGAPFIARVAPCAGICQPQPHGEPKPRPMRTGLRRGATKIPEI